MTKRLRRGAAVQPVPQNHLCLGSGHCGHEATQMTSGGRKGMAGPVARKSEGREGHGEEKAWT